MIEDTSAMDRPVAASRRSTRLIGAAVAILIVVGIGGLLVPMMSRWAHSDASIDTARLRVGEVTRGDLVREISVEGRVVAAFHPTVYSPAEGIVTTSAMAGQVVDRGDLLARVASPELESQAAQERASLSALQASYERLQLEAERRAQENLHQVELQRVEATAAGRALERSEHLFELGLINEIDLETARDLLTAQSLRLDQATRTLDMDGRMLQLELENSAQELDRQRLVVIELRRQMQALAIRAPVAGLVSRLHVEDQQAVHENDPLVTVVDLSALEIEVLIAESDADEISAGTEASLAFDGATYTGAVASIAPEVEASRVRGRVRFSGAPPPGLKQNQRVTARLLLEQRHDVLKAPRGPFLESGGGRQAYVLENGFAVRRTIEIGGRSISEVEIRAGLEQGERIIVSGLEQLQEAERVLLR